MDEMIDRALESYVAREAPVGIESRVLARVREPRRKLWAAWVVAAAAAGACAVVGIVSQPVMKKPAPVVIQQERGQAESLSYPKIAQARPQASMRSGHYLDKSSQAAAIVQPVPHRRRTIKRRVFPTPEPLPVAEVELARLAAQQPAIAKSLLARLEPIEIEPITIGALKEE